MRAVFFLRVSALVAMLFGIAALQTGPAQAAPGCYINDMGDAVCDWDGEPFRPRPLPPVPGRPKNPCIADPSKCLPPKIPHPTICDLFPELCTACPKPVEPPPAAGPCGGKSGLPWASGFSPGTGRGSVALENARGFGNWRGRPVDVGIVFIGKNSWQTSYEAYLTNEVLRPDGAVRAFSEAGICPVLTVPLVTLQDFMKFGMVASGGIDAKHQAIANKIKEAIGDGVIYLRLGHEADEGYPWSYTNPDVAPANPAEYKAAWGRISKIYKTTIPNARIVWNVLKNTRLSVKDYYPGSDVVDVISIDPYDNGSGGFCDSATSRGWVNMCYGSYDPASGKSKGVNGILQFAKSVGKRIAVDEWGASNKPHTAEDGANNSYYAAAMYDFFNANKDYIEYESYYNRAGAGKHQIWPRVEYNGKVSDAYLSKYRGTVPVPPTTPPASPLCPPTKPPGPIVPGDPVNIAPVCSTLGWLSGAYAPKAPFEALRPQNIAKANICTVFSKVSNDWAGMLDASSGTVDAGLKMGCANLSIAVRIFPMSFSSDSCPSNYARAANGEFDNYYIAMAKDLKAAGVPANAVLRIGWELNSDYPWGLLGCKKPEDAQNYINAFRRIVDIFRANFGNEFSVAWNFLKNSRKLAMPVDSFYPGDDYIDIIDIDYYDNSLPSDSIASFNAYANQGDLNYPMGINKWAEYAQSKSKKIGFAEWGIVPRDRGGKGDNPVYIQAMYEWFESHACMLAYESYFNGGSRGHELGTAEHPRSTAKYRELWGGSVARPKAPDETCSCTP